MVSTMRFRSFKTIDLQSRRPYTVLILVAGAMVAIWAHPRAVLVVMAYTYLASAFIGMGIQRFKHRGGRGSAETPSGRSAGADARNSAPSAAR
jgi:phosphatidylserine synthase